MIKADQPAIFPKEVLAGVSSTRDGTMKWGTDTELAVSENRRAFLEACTTSSDAAVIRVTYDGKDYCRYAVAEDAPSEIIADGVATRASRIPLFLPLADCTGVIMYDPVRHALMVSRLGRHSTEQYGVLKAIEFLAAQYGSSPKNLLVWLSPSPNPDSHPLWQFENRSFREVIAEQCLSAGVLQRNIEIAESYTTKNDQYFSHSEYLAGHQEVDGRYAIAAMLV